MCFGAEPPQQSRTCVDIYSSKLGGWPGRRCRACRAPAAPFLVWALTQRARAPDQRISVQRWSLSQRAGSCLLLGNGATPALIGTSTSQLENFTIMPIHPILRFRDTPHPSQSPHNGPLFAHLCLASVAKIQPLEPPTSSKLNSHCWKRTGGILSLAVVALPPCPSLPHVIATALNFIITKCPSEPKIFVRVWAGALGAPIFPVPTAPCSLQRSQCPLYHILLTSHPSSIATASFLLVPRITHVLNG